MKFHDDTKQILKAATLLALSRGSPEVDLDHLLECDPEDPAPASYRDIPFSAAFLNFLKKSADLAALQSSNILRPVHLELTLLSTLARNPRWGYGKPNDPLVWLLDSYFLAQLKLKGVNCELLRKSLSGLTLRQCRPHPNFLQTPEGQRFQELVKTHTLHPLATKVFIVLSYLISGGPAASPLSQAGVTEQILLSLLGPEARPTVDLSAALGPGLQRLSLEARHTFHTAWRLRGGPQMESDDLLRGLVATLNPLNHNPTLGQLLEPLSSHLPATQQLPEVPVPELSSEVYRVFDAALKEAGPDQPVTNRHLLLALAHCQNPLLAQHGLTLEQIRQALS